MNDYIGIAALFVLVLLNGYFVAVEYALVSVRRTRIDQLAEEGNATARVVQRVLGRLDLYIAAVQLGVSMMSLLIGFVAEPAIEHLAEPLFERLGLPQAYEKPAAFALAFILSTTFHIVLGELVPKSAALQKSEQLSLAMVRPLVLFTTVFRPVILGLNWLGGLVLRLLGLKAVAGHHTAYSEEEIRMIVSASSQEGVLEDDEKELVYNVFDLSDTTVREVMTPRIEMVLMDSAAPLRRLLDMRAEHGYSRIPVFQDTPDNIVGIVHTSDVLAHLDTLDHTLVADIMRPVFFVPEGMKIKDLLAKMRDKKSHLSIVVDEFGGTSGLVTLEDALEEIVGEIYDETDEEEVPMIEVIGEGMYLMDASLTVGEVEERLGSNIEDGEGEFDTLSGFMTSHFGDIPEAGQHFSHNGWTFTVEAADQRRVTRVRVERALNPDFLETEPNHD
ncbi:hemolysin family protein [Deinococcus multiflagellatus]|uniref:Hemolysin family protein n=1 Tax=Deinococcus multiflagellatus TaxID=1656887 RepID=A0ABW1ZHK8_9DEIO|nr:hemolysin family protein [Deinococcus multiflagellatus]MBZ9712980.1 hemolysin family protein [Deinococcus multiflagellatus]